MKKEEILSQIRDRFGSDILETSSDEVRVQCPYCRDSGRTYEDYKLYINASTGQYWCHRCHSSGVLANSGFSYSSVSDVYDIITSISVDSDEQYLFKLPEKLAIDNISSLEYLKSRGISESDIYYYSIRVESMLSNSRLSGRVVIPNEVINFDFTDMYSARSYIGSDIRYLNSYGAHASSIVFNIHRIRDSASRIIINEGPINSIIAGRDSVATYGKYVSREKLRKILDKYPKEIVISLDKDAISESYNLANSIKKISSSILVRIVDLPLGEDAASLGVDKYMKLVEQAEEYKSRLYYSIGKYIKNIN